MTFVRCDCIIADKVVQTEDCKVQTREFDMPVCPRRRDVCEPYCPTLGTLNNNIMQQNRQQYSLIN